VFGLISITGLKHLRALLAKKKFQRRPHFFAVSVEPLVVYNCAFFHPRVFNAPLKGSGFPSATNNCVLGSQETRMMGLSDGRKSFQIGLAVLIQYRHVTDTQPPTLP